MKKYIKSISMFICGILVISMLAQTSFAAEFDVDEQSLYITKDSIIPSKLADSSSSDDFLNSEEYEVILDEVSQKAKATITPELKEKVKKIRNELNNSKEFNDIITPFASYDSVSLEALLCSNDGLSALDIFAIGWTHANAARDEAIKLYTDTSTEMKRDAFRHMTWNFRSLKGVGEHETRVATINHEWAYKILPAVNQYEQERYDYYFDLYYTQIMLGLISVTDIMAMAKVDADAYAITYRDELIERCKNSLSIFNSTFNSNSYIMDFWNNKIGRDYGKSHSLSSTNDVFTMAWNANKLIKNETSSAVTSSVRSTLHSTNWWYIW